MTTAVADILTRVRNILQDETGIRWDDDELVDWVNDAQSRIVLLKPDASATTSVLTLVAGTLQSLPAGAHRLLNVTRNMSAASSGTGGRAIRLTEREILDAQQPSWHDPSVTGFAAHGTTVKHYVYDEQDPLKFYVFPGVSGDAFAEIVYSTTPEIVASDDDISLPDIYSSAIVDYVLYRAYSKDAEYAANGDMADKYLSLFESAIIGKTQIDTITDVNRKRTGSPAGYGGMNRRSQ